MSQVRLSSLDILSMETPLLDDVDTDVITETADNSLHVEPKARNESRQNGILLFKVGYL